MDALNLNPNLIYFININSLIKEKYKRISQLPEEQRKKILSQLYWVQENTRFTPQADALYDGSNTWAAHLNREIFRALCRIEMLLLLREVNEQNVESLYEEFTLEQSNSDKLTKESFQILAKQMQALDPTQVNAQIYASVIASVTLSPEAIRRADELFGKGKWPYDSVQFSGYTVREAGHLYPIYEEANEDERLILQHCFPADSRHWRHAFFLENITCLDPLKEQLKNANSPETRQSAVTECQNWLTYWLINALGFEGHVKNMQGSHFMTESVFQRAISLNENIKFLFEKVEVQVDVLAQYSQTCLEKLGITIHNPKFAIFIMKLANMTNIFNIENAVNIRDYVQKENLYSILDLDYTVFHEQRKIATYVPGFLQNVYYQAPEGAKIALIVKALHWANTVIASSDHQTTSFMNLSKEHCTTLINNDFNVYHSINEKGEVNNIQVISSSSNIVSFRA